MMTSSEDSRTEGNVARLLFQRRGSAYGRARYPVVTSFVAMRVSLSITSFKHLHFLAFSGGPLGITSATPLLALQRKPRLRRSVGCHRTPGNTGVVPVSMCLTCLTYWSRGEVLRRHDLPMRLVLRIAAIADGDRLPRPTIYSQHQVHRR